VIFCIDNARVNALRAGRPGDRISVGAMFYAPVQNGPADHPAFYTMGTGSLPGIKRPERGANPHLAPRLKKEYSYISTPPSVPSRFVMGGLQGK
jgi:hypothetical protein